MSSTSKTDPPKGFDRLLEAAFQAGVSFGAGFPEVSAIPEGQEEEAYRAWRDRWAGLPHEDPGDATENPPHYTPGAPPGHYTITADEAEDMGAGGLFGDPLWEQRVPNNPPLVFDLLCLVRSEFPGAMPKPSEIKAWDNRLRLQVATWAAAVHMSASDNEIEIPPIPAILQGDGNPPRHLAPDHG